MTIYDIAKEAGVSASTVSRVINNKPGINEKTRQKIFRLLKKYNYSPNEIARGLSTNETKLIGILLADIRNAHHTEIAYRIEQRLTGLGYGTLIFNTGLDDNKKASYIEILAMRRVDGAILVGSTFQNDVVKNKISVQLPNIPIVMANGYLELPNVFGVLVDEQDGVENCVNLLFKKQKEKIAFVLPNHTPSNLKKCQGYQNGMLNHGFGRDRIWIYENCTSAEGGHDIIDLIYQDHPDVEAVIFGEDLPAVGCIRALLEKGIKIPQQLSVIGVDNSLYGTLCYPQLTSLNNKMVETSEEAVRILIATLNGEKPCNKIMLYSDIIERGTT